MLTLIICKYADKLREDVNIPGVLAVCAVMDCLILTTLACHI